MAISNVGCAQGPQSTSAVTSYTQTVTSGVVDGDLLLWVMAASNASVVTAPAGWQVAASANPTGIGITILYRIASSEPSSYTVSGLSSTRWAGAMFAYRGVDTTTPFDVAIPASVYGTTTTTCPAITPVTAGAWVWSLPCGRGSYSSPAPTYSFTNGSSVDGYNGCITKSTGVNTFFTAGHIPWSGSGSFQESVSTTQVTQYTLGFTLALRPSGPTTLHGSATGTVSATGSASGTSLHHGAATGTVSATGSASGTSLHHGAATGTVAATGSASGQMPVPNGSATGTVSATGSATGTSLHHGAATGTVSATGSATGTSLHHGAATGTVSATGSASGTSPRNGSATGTVSATGSATGPTTLHGSAAGTVAATGSASGTSPRNGAASGAVSATGSVTGTSLHHGAATGAVSATGSAAGATSGDHGAATGAVSATGSASGTRVPRGTASGLCSVSGSASGHKVSRGTASGLCSITGSASGHRVSHGSVSGLCSVSGFATANTSVYETSVVSVKDTSRRATGLTEFTRTRVLGDTSRTGSVTGTGRTIDTVEHTRTVSVEEVSAT